MQSSLEELRVICKQMESEYNRKFFSKINSLTFIHLASQAMEDHLNFVVSLRGCTRKWLAERGFPTRDDVADTAIKLIEIEHMLDLLDDDLYQMVKQVEESHKQLAGLRIIIKDLSTELKMI